MADASAFLTLRIDTQDPIELGDFVGAFTSLAEEYQRQIQEHYKDLGENAHIYVKQVREGSIIAELIPYLSAITSVVPWMDQVMIVEQFVTIWGQRISALVSGELEGWDPKNSELEILLNTINAVAHDPNASSTLKAVSFEDGQRKIRAAFKFKTPEARKAQATIDKLRLAIETPDNEQHKRVLMVFTRTDVGDAAIGKKSGERVLIEEIDRRSLALMYASELAEQRLKHEIREAEDNVYKKGFVVDVTDSLARVRSYSRRAIWPPRPCAPNSIAAKPQKRPKNSPNGDSPKAKCWPVWCADAPTNGYCLRGRSNSIYHHRPPSTHKIPEMAPYGVMVDHFFALSFYEYPWWVRPTRWLGQFKSRQCVF